MERLGITPASLAQSLAASQKGNFEINVEAPNTWTTLYRESATGPTLTEPLRPLCMTTGVILRGDAALCCDSRCRGRVTLSANGRHAVRYECLQPKCVNLCKEDYSKLAMDKWLYYEFIQVVQAHPGNWDAWASFVVSFAKPLKQMYIRHEYRMGRIQRAAELARKDGLKGTSSPAPSQGSKSGATPGTAKRGGILEIGRSRKKHKTTNGASVARSASVPSATKGASPAPTKEDRELASLRKRMAQLEEKKAANTCSD